MKYPPVVQPVLLSASFVMIGLLVIGGVILDDPVQPTATVQDASIPSAQTVQVNPVPSETQKIFTITAVGDIMLDRYVRETINQKGMSFPFEKIQSELTGDLVLGNLEGPFTNQPSVATNEHLIFTFDPALAPVLHDVGFTTLSVANNHMLNFGQAGLETTRQIASAANLNLFGDPHNAHGFGLVEEVRDHRIAFIGYHGLVGGLDTILNDVREAKANGLLTIVMPHWGNEYQSAPSARQISDAHALIDAGAGLIIGAHPHVVQPFELYKEKFIAYSLGNFLFDQYFSPSTLEGLLLRFSFDDDVLGIEFVPIVTVNGQVTRLDLAKRDTLLKRIADTSTLGAELKTQVMRGRLTIPYVQPTP